MIFLKYKKKKTDESSRNEVGLRVWNGRREINVSDEDEFEAERGEMKRDLTVERWEGSWRSIFERPSTKQLHLRDYKLLNNF